MVCVRPGNGSCESWIGFRARVVASNLLNKGVDPERQDGNDGTQ